MAEIARGSPRLNSPHARRVPGGVGGAIFLSKRTDADFEAWRQQRDWTKPKYAAWARGE